MGSEAVGEVVGRRAAGGARQGSSWEGVRRAAVWGS